MPYTGLVESMAEAFEERWNPGVTKTAEYQINKNRRIRREHGIALIIGGAIAAAMAVFSFISGHCSPCYFYLVPWCFSTLCTVLALFENVRDNKLYNEEEVKLVMES
jgi:hypothetical protein